MSDGSKPQPCRVIGNKVYCNMCHGVMHKARTLPNQHRREKDGRIIKVTRVLYFCPKCKTVYNFDYRQDGKQGDMNKTLQIQRALKQQFGQLPNIMGGKLTDFD